MSHSNHIIKELQGLQANSLAENIEPVFRVPVGYFTQLLPELQERLQVEEIIGGFSTQLPFTKPEQGYFSSLPQVVLSRIKNEDSLEDESETLSPLLAQLKQSNPFQIPEGYTFGKEKAEVVTFPNTYQAENKLKKMGWVAAVAAVFIFVLGGFNLLKPVSVSLPNNVSSIEIALSHIPDETIQQFLAESMDEAEFYTLTEGYYFKENPLGEFSEEEWDEILAN